MDEIKYIFQGSVDNGLAFHLHVVLDLKVGFACHLLFFSPLLFPSPFFQYTWTASPSVGPFKLNLPL